MSEDSIEKLYRINCNTYVQYNGQGEAPKELKDYVKVQGEMPSYMNLPTRKVNFWIQKGVSISWSGKGPLPESVIKYVNMHGYLPQNDSVDNTASKECNANSDEDWVHLENEEDGEWEDQFSIA